MKWFGNIFSRKKKQARPKFGVSGLGRFGTFDGIGDHIELLMAGSDQPSPLFNKETDLAGYVLDSNCIV